MSAEGLLFAAGLEQGVVPTRGTEMPDAAAAYLRAGMRSIDHGCGHVADVRFVSPPIRSALCPACAQATGLLARALRCGRCRRLVDPAAGDWACVAAVEPAVVLFAAMCKTCVNHEERQDDGRIEG